MCRCNITADAVNTQFMLPEVSLCVIFSSTHPSSHLLTLSFSKCEGQFAPKIKLLISVSMGQVSAITICKLRKIQTPCGLTSGKRPPPASDHISLTLWVVAYGRFDCSSLQKTICHFELYTPLKEAYKEFILTWALKIKNTTQSNLNNIIQNCGDWAKWSR